MTHTITATTARVMTHRGVLSSLEFARIPDGIERANVSVEVMELAADDPGLSGAIDEEEHGPG